MPHSVTVELGPRSYDILVQQGALDQTKDLLFSHLNNRKAIIITDANVAAHQLARLAIQFPGSDPIILPAGESTKSWASLSSLCDTLLAQGIERGDYLIAFGGGVIGDLVGFAASIIKRGCKFIQIPTSLLAMVDSSVGGKTAINVPAGKNLIGAFYQPRAVLIDPTVLASLPPRDLRSGYAEVVKYGLINDADFFAWCESNGAKVLDGDIDAQTTAIMHSIATKAQIVAADERETDDIRALLNLGHTFGHALEAETGFSEALTHGEAVAAGIALAHAYSSRINLCPEEDVKRVCSHLKALGLPDSLVTAGVKANGTRLVDHMRHDKKMSQGALPFILSHGIGKAAVESRVDLRDIADFLDEYA